MKLFENEIEKYKDSEHFMEVAPVGLWENFYRARYNRNQLDLIRNACPLHIIQTQGIDVQQDFDMTVTDLNTSVSNKKFKHFHNSGDGGITFKIEVIINKNESWGYGLFGQSDFVYYGVKYPARARVIVWLNYWLVNMTPLYVVSDAIDIPNGKYILTKNSSRKQEYYDYTVWNLEFATYDELSSFEVNPLDVLAKYTGKSPKKDTPNSNLATCDLNNFVYCKEKTATTQCTRWLQNKLYQLGFLPKLYTTGWYNDEVLNAVKLFQFKYQSYFPNMKVNGKMDKVTLDALCSM